MLSNVLPMYTTGVDTGMIVDCGFQQTQILPVVRSRICPEALKVSYASGANVEKEVNRLLLKDNIKNMKLLERVDQRLPACFPSKIIEGIKTRAL